MSEAPIIQPSTAAVLEPDTDSDAQSVCAPRRSMARLYDPECAYDGLAPFPELPTSAPESSGPWRVQVAVTILLVAGPLLAVAVALWVFWGHGVGWVDVLLFLVFYVVTGLGVTIGYHRGLTHRSFTARPGLRVVLATAGAMAFEGDPINWVAGHRRHHAFTDRPGDPHSPYRFGTGLGAQLHGLVDSHIGWLFRYDPTPAERWAPDLLAEPGICRVARWFPALCVLSLALPFALGWAITGTLSGAGLALLWAGLVRVALLQHITWSVNSLCHVMGDRPFVTKQHDRATNLWPMALPSFGESWHNAHHADPSCARHGIEPHQIDVSAEVIRLFERVGWVSNVKWPTPERVASMRREEPPCS